MEDKLQALGISCALEHEIGFMIDLLHSMR